MMTFEELMERVGPPKKLNDYTEEERMQLRKEYQEHCLPQGWREQRIAEAKARGRKWVESINITGGCDIDDDDDE